MSASFAPWLAPGCDLTGCKSSDFLIPLLVGRAFRIEQVEPCGRRSRIDDKAGRRYAYIVMPTIETYPDNCRILIKCGLEDSIDGREDQSER
jgi:hypothetical protein